MEQHPDVNVAIVLRDDADREYPSRVEDLGSGLLVVAQPRDLPADDGPAAGAELSVTWADADGAVMALPTRILAAHEAGGLPVWSLVVTGPATSAQRRRSERAPAVGSVAIRPTGADESDVVTGSLVDVSEGGVRCRVAAGAADRFLAGAHQVVAEFRLGAVDFAVPGRVEFLRATKHPAELEDLVVVFDEPVPDAAALHDEVLAQQARTPEAAEDAP